MSAFVEFERALAIRCKAMREEAERILAGLDAGLFANMPETGGYLRRLALGTLEAVDQYERDRDADGKNPPAA